jgi:hypothetical protein
MPVLLGLALGPALRSRQRVVNVHRTEGFPINAPGNPHNLLGTSAVMQSIDQDLTLLRGCPDRAVDGPHVN